MNQIIRLIDLMRLRLVYHNIARAIEQGQYDLAYVQPCQYEIAPSVDTLFAAACPYRLLLPGAVAQAVREDARQTL